MITISMILITNYSTHFFNVKNKVTQMKRLFTLLALVVVLAVQSQAAIYLVGQSPVGLGWDPSKGIEMTDNGNGTYQYVVSISGTVYFCFADQLAASSSDWSTFNSDYRYGPSSKDYKVVTNTDVPVGKNGDYSFRFDGDGTEYKIIFNLNALTIRIEGNDSPEVNPITGDCFILGEIGGNTWAPDLGVKMSTTDGNIFTTTAATTNLSDYSYFSFTTKLATSADDWGSITDYRLGAQSDADYEVTSDMLGTEIGLSAFGGTTAFKIAPGEYKFTVNVNEKTLVISGNMSPIDPITGDVFVMGEVNGNGWAANTGVKMSTTDQNVYTTTITTDGANVDENDGIGYSYFNFTTKLAETSDGWETISAYRFGASDVDYLVSSDQLGIDLSLSNYGVFNSYKIPAGTYDLTLNLADKTLVIATATGIKGDVNGDGVVSLADINAIIEMMLNNNSSTKGDVNEDGQITIADINAVIGIMLAD